MKYKPIRLAIAGAALVGTFISTDAPATNCRTQNRNYPGSGGSDTMTLTCKHIQGTEARGSATVVNQNGTKTMTAVRSAGSGIGSMTIIGINLVGVSTCSVIDSVVDNNPVSGTCNAAVRWNAQLTTAP